MAVRQSADRLLHRIDYTTDQIAALNRLRNYRTLSPVEAVRLRDFHRERNEANRELMELLGDASSQLLVSREEAIRGGLRRVGNAILVGLTAVGASGSAMWPIVPRIYPKDSPSSA